MIFLLFGEDPYRSKEKLADLKSAFLSKNPSAEVKTFDFSERNFEVSTIFETISSGELFSKKKMTIIKSAFSSLSTEHQKNISKNLQSMDGLEKDPENVLVFWEKGVPKKSLSLWKHLSSSSKSQRFDLLSPKELEHWVFAWCKNHAPEISFSDKAAHILVSYVGNDLFLMEKELEKLSSFKISGKISEEDIEKLVKSNIHSNIFQAIEALLGYNKKLALKLFHEQLESGEDPFYMLSMYAYQIRTLIKIASLIEKNVQNPIVIAKLSGIHPYVVQKSMSQAKIAGIERLKDLFKKIQSIDLAAKTGKSDLKLAIDMFIVQA